MRAITQADVGGGTARAPRLLAIDPGTTDSAWVEFADGLPQRFAKEPNAQVLERVHRSSCDAMVVEMIEGYGMNVGNEVFRTCVWTGRFIQAWEERGRPEPLTVGRKTVKLHLCGTARANDAAVSHAIAERYGFDAPRLAKGTKLQPGPLYGIKADVWAALAVALTTADHLAAEAAATA